MKKFKVLIASMIGAIAFVIACVVGSVNVNAATTTTTYNYDWLANAFASDTDKTTLVAANSNKDFEISATENSYAKMKMNVENSSGSTFRYMTAGYVEFQKSSKSAVLTLTFESVGTVTFKSKINTGGSKKSPYYWSVDDGEETAEQIGTSGGSEVTITCEGAGQHTIVFREAHSNESTSDSSNLKMYSFEMVVSQTVESDATITALQQEGISGNYTYVRFIFIASNYTALAKANLTNALTIVLDKGLEGEQTITRTPSVVNKITNNGETYVGTVNNADYEFDNEVNSSDVYIIYVIKFTTAKYSGHTISAVLNYGSSYATTSYTFA